LRAPNEDLVMHLLFCDCSEGSRHPNKYSDKNVLEPSRP
jgi:hypothetical protein